MTINNKTTLFHKRKDLRNNATSQELMLWSQLKNSRLGFKFRRQHSLGQYIVDLYCPEKKIAVEIDGSQHHSVKGEAYDTERTEFIESKGIQVLRFTNAEVNTNMQGILLKIKEELESPPRLLSTKSTPPQ